MNGVAMKDPKTSFGQWFKQVTDREQQAAQRGAESSSSANGGDGFVNKLMFWRGNSNKDRRNEAGTDVERGGLLPSFMTPGSRRQQSDWCDCGLSATQRFQGFVACVIGGAALMGLALFVFLPMVLIFPAKFALTFTLGSFLIQTAFAMLRGPGKHIRGMFARDRLGSSLIYLSSMGMTLYSAIIARSYILVICSVSVQVGALLWSSVSYLPRGQAALSVFTTLFCKVAQVMCYPCKSALKRMLTGGSSSSGGSSSGRGR